MEEKLTDQERARRDKLPRYIEMGVDPYGQKFERSELISTVREKCAGKTNEELEAHPVYVTLAGRVMALRKMGKASFMNIKDISGRIQCYVGIDVVGEETYNVFKLADIGDIVGVYGRVMLTRTGELTVRVEKYTHLTKSLRPLPEKFHGLTDVEERYRHRYVDLIMNDDSLKIAVTRPKIIRAIQSYCDSLGFTEVETSVLSPILGGASARPFITHHNALDKDFYLRIATEINLKKCIVGGMEKVYEIGRLFRNEGMDTKHNPEFTTIELYQAYGDLQDMRHFCENLFKEVAMKVVGSTTIPYGEGTLDLGKPFGWKSMVEVVKEATGVDFSKDMSLEEAVDLVLFAFKHGQNGDILVQKAPACTIGMQAEAVCEMFGGKKEDIKVIGIRHGEKMYETLLTKEECAKAEDLGNFYRVPADNRGLNYDKYFTDGNKKAVTIEEFNSDNARRLNKKEIIETMMKLTYIQEELAK